MFIISVATAIAELPEIGLKIASGIISFGIFIVCIIGNRQFIIKSSKPEFLRAPTATNNPISVGKIL